MAIEQQHAQRKLELKPLIGKLNEELDGLAEYSGQSRRSSSTIDETQILHDSEVDAIIDALANRRDVLTKHIGPRSVRAFLFRYQRLGIQWTSAALASHGTLSSRFARVRVRAAHLDRIRQEEWLLIEWPADQSEPTHYWLSTLPAKTPFKHLVANAMGRWMIERDYQELKSELGLSHYEGRNWRGFHHHATLCIAAYGFLMLERSLGSVRASESIGDRF